MAFLKLLLKPFEFGVLIMKRWFKPKTVEEKIKERDDQILKDINDELKRNPKK